MLRIGILAGAVMATAGAAQAAELVFDDIVARVLVIPEARSDIQVEITPGRAGLPAPQVRRTGANVRIEGDSEARQCTGAAEEMRIRLRGGAELSMAEAPMITVRAPRSVTISKNGGAVVGRIGRTQDLRLQASGCSHWTVADVAGTLVADQSGGARMLAGQARTAQLRASGGGVIDLRGTANLEANGSGGGVVRVASVSGPVEADGSGGGGVKVSGGRASLLRADASGGGWVDFDGVADALDAEASGGGRVSVARVTGTVNQSASGGGRVSVGR